MTSGKVSVMAQLRRVEQVLPQMLAASRTKRNTSGNWRRRGSPIRSVRVIIRLRRPTCTAKWARVPDYNTVRLSSPFMVCISTWRAGHMRNSAPLQMQLSKRPSGNPRRPLSIGDTGTQQRPHTASENPGTVAPDPVVDILGGGRLVFIGCGGGKYQCIVHQQAKRYGFCYSLFMAGNVDQGRARRLGGYRSRSTPRRSPGGRKRESHLPSDGLESGP